jgi:hypothetical protein
MSKPVKDLVRHQKMEMMPAALPGEKKHWNADTQEVTYVPQTLAEVARQAIKPPPKPRPITSAPKRSIAPKSPSEPNLKGRRAR